MEHARRTKLVCTIGPATSGRAGELVAAGMDVARINFSHGAPSDHEAAVTDVREAADAAGRPVAVLADLAGPKIRLGELAGDGVELEAGRRFTLRPGAGGPGDLTGAAVTDPGLGSDVRPGDRILLADGAAELRVTKSDGEVETEVVRGGRIRSGAGVAIPADRLSGPSLTPKDRSDAPRAVALGADYVAQSFVRRPSDVLELRALLGPGGPPIVAKIETRPAVDAFDAILDVVDAVMVARGDLGVELAYEEVPLVQKQLVRRALDRGIPSIVATQMLESMIASPRPTRAEASDVANAVFDGADAIMLCYRLVSSSHVCLLLASRAVLGRVARPARARIIRNDTAICTHTMRSAIGILRRSRHWRRRRRKCRPNSTSCRIQVRLHAAFMSLCRPRPPGPSKRPSCSKR
jgi:pyruvate kinase